MFEIILKQTFRIILVFIFSTTPVNFSFSNECSLETFKRPTHKQRRHFCTPFTGQKIVDGYTNGKKILCEKMEVDHCVSLSWARKNGVCGDDLKRLANDPRNLIPTYWLTNRKKGAKGLHEFVDNLPTKIRSKVLSRCEPVLRDYSIVAKKDLMKASLERYKIAKTASNSSIPYYLVKKNLPKNFKEQLLIKNVGGRSVVFLGKKALGYAAGVGVALEILTFFPTSLEQISEWTAEDFNKRKRARNDFFKEIIEAW